MFFENCTDVNGAVVILYIMKGKTEPFGVDELPLFGFFRFESLRLR